MLKDKNSSHHDNRNLSDVFKELQEMQNPQNRVVQSTGETKRAKKQFASSSRVHTYHRNSDLTLSHIITGCAILVVGMAVFFPKDLAFNESYAKEEDLSNISEYELNRHSINIQNIISENVDVELVKEQVVDERDVEFETSYKNNPTLPKGEEIILQEGALGKDKVTAVKTYKSGEEIEEVILNKERLQDPVTKEIDLGTSEFLAKHKVHIGDIMYLTETATLKDSLEEEAEETVEVNRYLDVKLLELASEEWAKVSYDGIEGYIKTSLLTSPTTTPNIVERNRVERILLKVNIEMELNKPSGLTLNDYKKIFTGLSSDTNKIFQNNYAAFYNAEKKYNINGLFLASMAIHESAWGSSQIANDKNNLFGYGSYDSTPYESSFEFENHQEGIETVAKSLVKYYLNPVGTKIYDNEKAVSTYYNGPTLAGVNTRYATDATWHEKVFKYMELLYNRL